MSDAKKLYDAVEAVNAAEAQRLLKKGVNPNEYKDSVSEPHLRLFSSHYAALKGSVLPSSARR